MKLLNKKCCRLSMIGNNLRFQHFTRFKDKCILKCENSCEMETSFCNQFYWLTSLILQIAVAFLLWIPEVWFQTCINWDFLVNICLCFLTLFLPHLSLTLWLTLLFDRLYVKADILIKGKRYLGRSSQHHQVLLDI